MDSPQPPPSGKPTDPGAAPSAPSVARPPGSATDALIGAVLADRYEIVRRIGEGGMGAVYEGRHVVLRRQVAVKVLLEKFLEKTELVARLLQEARVASAIGHENIVDVTDFGTTTDGRAFVVMEYLEGEALAALVTREAPLPVERCLRIARQIASALGAAHGKGIVHRDIKPENVFLMRRGEQDFVKVVDFGVSKAVRSREDGAELLRLTRTGMVLGTPLYMSPEQARGGEDVDARADIWAVGVLLYECLTGEVPFRASNYLGVISQVLTQEVQPPSRLRPELGIPPAVEAVVMRAMAKERSDRYQDMGALERDIDRLLAGDPNVGVLEEAVPAPAELNAPRARWHLGIAAIVVVGLAVSVALLKTEEERRRAERAAAMAAAAQKAMETAAASAARAAALRPVVPPVTPPPLPAAPAVAAPAAPVAKSPAALAAPEARAAAAGAGDDAPSRPTSPRPRPHPEHAAVPPPAPPPKVEHRGGDLTIPRDQAYPLERAGNAAPVNGAKTKTPASP